MSIAFTIPNVFKPENVTESYLHVLNENMTPRQRDGEEVDEVALGWMIKPVANSEELNPQAIGDLPVAGIDIKQIILTLERSGTIRNIRTESLLYRLGQTNGFNPINVAFEPVFYRITPISSDVYSNRVDSLSPAESAQIRFSDLEGFLGDTKSYFFSGTELKILLQHFIKAQLHDSEIDVDLVFSGSRAGIGRVSSAMNMQELDSIRMKHNIARSKLERVVNHVQRDLGMTETSFSDPVVAEVAAEVLADPNVQAKVNHVDLSFNNDLSEWFTLKAEVKAVKDGTQVFSHMGIPDTDGSIGEIFQLDMKLLTMSIADPCPPGYEALGVIHTSIERYILWRNVQDQLTLMEQKEEVLLNKLANLDIPKYENEIESLRKEVQELKKQLTNLSGTALNECRYQVEKMEKEIAKLKNKIVFSPGATNCERQVEELKKRNEELEKQLTQARQKPTGFFSRIFGPRG